MGNWWRRKGWEARSRRRLLVGITRNKTWRGTGEQIQDAARPVATTMERSLIWQKKIKPTQPSFQETLERQTWPHEVHERPWSCLLSWEAIRGLDQTNDVPCPCLLLGILGRWDKKRRIWLWQMSPAGVRASQAIAALTLTTFSAICMYTQIC